MARGTANIQLDFSALDSSRLAEKLQEKINKKLRSNFGKLRPNIETAINRGVERSKRQFTPDAEEIAQLGVGQGGSPDIDRIQNAYRELRTDFGRKGITRFSVRKAGTGAGILIGKLSVQVKKETFLSSGLPVVKTPDSKAISEIPWMRWLIRGKQISGFEFKKSSKKTSRTGMGVMISGGIWDFKPARPNAFLILDRNIRHSIAKTIQGLGARIVK